MRLDNFTPQEFREWWPMMSPRLLTMLDVLRFRLSRGITISPHPRSLGRRLGPDSHSEHNVDHWGEVLAVDCFIDNVTTEAQARQIVERATKLGFTGIGVYPEWTNSRGEQQVGFHLGVRPNRDMGNPASWGWLGGKMVSMETALRAIGGTDADD